MMHKSGRNDTVSPGFSTSNSFDRYPYMKHSTADQTLGDYINRMVKNQAIDDVAKEEKQLFIEWFYENYPHAPHLKDHLECAWKAGQENK